jgi:hypothetical protein
MRTFVALLLLAVPAVAIGQDKEKPKGEKLSASGTIKSIGPGGLQVISAAGDQWQVALAPKAEVVVTGTATPAFLRPGMLVKFSGKFNKKAETVEPLSSITVYTPREEKKQWREEDAGSEFGKGLFKADEPMATDNKKKKKPAESIDVSSGGAIASARGGKLSVRAPEATFKIALTEDAQVALDVNDVRLARVGDKVELEGWTYPGDVTKVMANRVVIRLSETLGEKTDKKK